MTAKDKLREEYYALRRSSPLFIAARRGFSIEREVDMQLDALRREAGNGFDEELWRDELTKLSVGICSSGPTYNPMIEEFAGEIEKQIAKIKPEFCDTVFAGEWVTGDFNACSLSVNNGTLLLINSGAMTFIHQVITLLGYRVKFQENNLDIIEPQRVVSILASTVVSYFVSGESATAERVPPLYGFKGELVAGVRRECERFILAHEYGHAIAGHQRPPDDMKETMRLARAWGQEFEADQLGLQLLLAEDDDYVPRESEFRLSIREKIAGAFFFFSMADLIAQGAAALRDREFNVDYSESHPPGRLRAQKLCNYLLQSYSAKHIERSLLWSRILDEASNAAASLIREM